MLIKLHILHIGLVWRICAQGIHTLPTWIRCQNLKDAILIVEYVKTHSTGISQLLNELATPDPGNQQWLGGTGRTWVLRLRV